MFDFQMWKVVLKILRLGPKFLMIQYKENWPMPVIAHPNQILAKTRLGGICASDLHQIDISEISLYASILANPNNPFPIGHELVAEVAEVGGEVTDLQKGDRVIYNPVPHCATYGFDLCPACKKGNFQACLCLVGVAGPPALLEQYGGKAKIGGLGGGGWSEYFVGTSKQFHKVPENIPDDVAVLTEPLAVGIHAVGRHLPKPTDTVLVVGAGAIGLMIIAALRGFKCENRIIALVRYPYQAEMAKQVGATECILERDPKVLYEKVAAATGGKIFQPTLTKPVIYGNEGPDIIYESVASESSMDDAIRLAKANGKIVIVGLGYTITKKIDWSVPVYKELEIVGSMMHGIQTFEGKPIDPFELALQFMVQDPDRYKGIVSHKFPLEEYKEAIKILGDKRKSQAIKVVFSFLK